PLDDYEESQVENALARLVFKGVPYKLVGASGSAKKGKFYFVDTEHSRASAERFQHWPQAAIVYFGILVSPCKVMMEAPDTRVLVVPDRTLGTNDCRGWIRRSLFQRLQEKHDEELLALQIDRLRRERHGTVGDGDLDEQERSILLHDAKREISGQRLPEARSYQFRIAISKTQAKGAIQIIAADGSAAPR